MYSRICQFFLQNKSLKFRIFFSIPFEIVFYSKQSSIQPPIFTFSIVGNTNTFNLRVKIESPNGLLLWTGGDDMSPASDFLLLAVENGFLHFRFNLGNGEGGVVYNDSKIDDGKWHRIRASRYICYTSTSRSLRSSCGICHQNKSVPTI